VLSKFFQKQSSRDASPDLVMLTTERKSPDVRSRLLEHRQNSPQLPRHPPPPYRRPSGGMGTIYGKPAVHHQRMSSAQEPRHPQFMVEPQQSAFIRYQQHRYSAGRQTASPEKPTNYFAAPPFIPYQPVHGPFVHNPFFAYANAVPYRQSNVPAESGYYDAFNSWFAHTGGGGASTRSTTSAAKAHETPTSTPLHERSRSYGHQATVGSAPPWSLYNVGIDARPPIYPPDARHARANAARSVYSSVGERF
jgi:hypothetical protein